MFDLNHQKIMCPEGKTVFFLTSNRLRNRIFAFSQTINLNNLIDFFLYLFPFTIYSLRKRPRKKNIAIPDGPVLIRPTNTNHAHTMDSCPDSGVAGRNENQQHCGQERYRL
jgi:hypothetical protein